MLEGLLEAALRGAIVALPLAIIVGLVVLIKGLIQRRKNK